MRLDSLRKEPYTVKELVGIIKKKIIDDGNWPDPDIVDYILSGEDVKILDTTFDVIPQVVYGGNEGIYLDVFLKGEAFNNSGKREVKFCTVKTLETSREAMRKMAILGADIEVDLTGFVNEHSRDCTWTGYSVFRLKDDVILPFGYWCPDEESATKKFQDMIDGNHHIILLENHSRKILEEKGGSCVV